MGKQAVKREAINSRKVARALSQDVLITDNGAALRDRVIINRRQLNNRQPSLFFVLFI